MLLVGLVVLVVLGVLFDHLHLDLQEDLEVREHHFHQIVRLNLGDLLGRLVQLVLEVR